MRKRGIHRFCERLRSSEAPDRLDRARRLLSRGRSKNLRRAFASHLIHTGLTLEAPTCPSAVSFAALREGGMWSLRNGLPNKPAPSSIISSAHTVHSVVAAGAHVGQNFQHDPGDHDARTTRGCV